MKGKMPASAAFALPCGNSAIRLVRVAWQGLFPLS